MIPAKLYQQNQEASAFTKNVLILTSEHRKRRLETLTINIANARSIYVKNVHSLSEKLHEQSTFCILIDWGKVPWLKLLQIHHLKNRFPHVKWIALVEEHAIEAAWKCGQLQIDKVIPISDSDSILAEIKGCLEVENLQITFEDIAIDKNNPGYSNHLKKTLLFIEKYYVQIKSIRYLAQCLGVSESVLAREFQASELDSPKKVLMQMKVAHAMKLMETTHLNNTNIARLSGFSNGKIMIQYFRREGSPSVSELLRLRTIDGQLKEQEFIRVFMKTEKVTHTHLMTGTD